MVTNSIRARNASGWAVSRSVAKSGFGLAALGRKRLLLFVDLLIVNVVLLVTVTLWNDFPLSPAAVLAHAKWFATLSVMWVLFGVVLDIYNLARAAHTSSIIASAGAVTLLSTVSYLAVPWLTPPILHRAYAGGLVLIATALVLGWRILYAQVLVQPAFRQCGLIFGGTPAAFELAHAIQRAGQSDNANPFGGTGYQIVGFVADKYVEDTDNGIPMLGEKRTLVRLARQYGVDELILAVDDEKQLSDEAREILLDSRELGLRITSLTEVYERLTGQLPVEYLHCNLSLLLSPSNGPATRLYRAVKRLTDVLMALVGLAFLGLLLPVVALINAMSSPGPLFYRQQRVGLGGKPFSLLKLRSMVPDAERCVGAVWCGDKDPRITPVGRLLRKTRLDELPQVVNVLRGEMSMIGPRPERPYFVGQLAKAMPIYRARHAVKPGITGWAQVHYEYGNSVEDSRNKLKYDLYYVKHANLFLDFLVLLHTVRVTLGAQGQ